MTAAEIIAGLRRDNERLSRLVSIYQAASRLKLDPFPAWALELTGQEAELAGALVKAYPRWLSGAQLFRVLSHSDSLPSSPPRVVVSVLVGKLRAKLGSDAIESQRTGYRLGPALVASQEARACG